jgi:hypothetical protein
MMTIVDAINRYTESFMNRLGRAKDFVVEVGNVVSSRKQCPGPMHAAYAIT